MRTLPQRSRRPASGSPGPRNEGGVHNLGDVEVLLVRHAHAGSKDGWSGDDRLRPLSRRGRADARALARVLASFRPARIVSSPLVRCVQTVAPAAAQLGLDIEESEGLGPDGGEHAAGLLRALAGGGGRVVVCTHGETIDAIQVAFAATGRGTGRRGGFRPGAPHEKGSLWVLRFAEGRLAAARYLPTGTGAPVALTARASV